MPTANVPGRTICEKCSHGEVGPAKTFRLSTTTAIIGYLLLIPGILLFCYSLRVGAFGVTEQSSAQKQAGIELKKNTLAELEALQPPPDRIISKFEAIAYFEETEIAQLDPESRAKVNKIKEKYLTGLAGTVIGTGIIDLLGGGFKFAMLIAAILMMILGLFLSLRKKIWHCLTCGYIFQRV